MAETPLEYAVLSRHRQATNPHPQYALLADLATRVGAVVGASAAVALGIGDSSSAGNSAEAARADHVHALPGVATTHAAGFMSANDKARLDSLAAASSSFKDPFFNIIDEADDTKVLTFSVGDVATAVTVLVSTGAQTADATFVLPIIADADTIAVLGVNQHFTATCTFDQVDIDAGTIDGTAIGGTTPAAASFTTIATSSTALVANLNADQLDSHDAAYFTDYADASASAAISAHNGASDPHGDRAFATAAIAALGLGTIATQAASAVAITGGAIDGAAIGGVTPAAGSFTTIIASGDLQLGVAFTAGAPGATGYVTVKDSLGNPIKLLCSDV